LKTPPFLFFDLYLADYFSGTLWEERERERERERGREGEREREKKEEGESKRI
jgi:hypothetical protein